MLCVKVSGSAEEVAWLAQKGLWLQTVAMRFAMTRSGLSLSLSFSLSLSLALSLSRSLSLPHYLSISLSHDLSLCQGWLWLIHSLISMAAHHDVGFARVLDMLASVSVYASRQINRPEFNQESGAGTFLNMNFRKTQKKRFPWRAFILIKFKPLCQHRSTQRGFG